MGLGLGIDHDGTNVAFTGGTGILVFLDLIALLICDKQQFTPKFKFLLYFAAPSIDEAIGIELCQKARDLGLIDLRLKIGSGPRWDQTFIQRELEQIGKIRKVFVCGPPAMNEVFDKAFEQIATGLGLSWKDIEIL